jgi:parallel beta-helix repeat protein
MWHRLISALAIAIILLFVWQEVQQGRVGVIPAGVVKIISNTDAQVYIDGQPAGTIRASQPRILNKLKPGRHIVGLTALGFKSKNMAVTLSNGQKLEQVFTLEPEPGVTPTTKTVGFKDLEQSIDNAEEGAVLFLAAGDYQLSSTVKVQKSISLIGAGQALTRVFSSAGVALISFKAGELHLKGISFVHTGKQKSDVMDIEDAKINIEDCRFTGGYTPDSPRKDGDGLWLHGHSSGKIINSQFESNALNGLEVRDDTNVLLENNQFSRNESAGLSVWENAKASVLNSTFDFNKKKGVQASDQAVVTITRNKFLLNTGSGIAFYKSATGSVKNNTITSNKYGLEIMDDSSVSVSQNLFSRHDEAIYVGKRASATIGKNTFSKNAQNVVYEK